MSVPVGLNVWSRLVEELFPYLDQTVAPFESLWFPDHVQYGANKVAEGWTLLAFALSRYPDKLGTHEVLCNSFRNPAHLAKMGATGQAPSGGRGHPRHRGGLERGGVSSLRLAVSAHARAHRADVRGHRADPAHVDELARDLQRRALPDHGRPLRAAPEPYPARGGGRSRREVSVARRRKARRLVELQLP